MMTPRVPPARSMMYRAIRMVRSLSEVSSSVSLEEWFCWVTLLLGILLRSSFKGY